MINEALRTNIHNAISDSRDLDTMFKILLDFRTKGGRQSEAIDTLEYMRKESSGEYEDKILEIMDFASGFCIPKYKVWQ